MAKHIIVDGSNIATEGRSEPSLAQLDEAVQALMAEYKGAKITVIVDATFGHRIAKKERAEFDTAIANNELVAPPAGAVGRGDAFILAIADKAHAAILSNDSYQEFHGKYKWLFDEGRLIGGKPVPLVGWVFVERLPVRGPTSRRSVRTGTVVKKQATVSPEASKPMPVPKAPPPNARLKQAPTSKQQPDSRVEKKAPQKSSQKTQQRTPEKSTAVTMANDVVPYLEFVEKHPVGSKVKAVVRSYAANGVSVMIGDVAGYVPLKNMAQPMPRSARDVFKIGDVVTLTVVGYTPARRSVDLGVPDVVASLIEAASTRTSSAKKVAAKKGAAKSAPAKKATTEKKSAPTKTAKKTSASQPAKKVVAKKSVAKKEAIKTPAKKSPAKKAAVKKVAAKKVAAKKK
jgi:Zc3h12a-like Ribonuclease NYN domain/S1 RNA binding domain